MSNKTEPSTNSTAALERGSQWRKWDLHVHIPGTHLNDQYKMGKNATKTDKWETFSNILEDSDVCAFGLTDYFDCSNVLEYINFHHKRQPNSRKLLLPNIELRLNETVNKKGEPIDFHIIFSEKTPHERIKQFFDELKTEVTTKDGVKVRASAIAAKKNDIEAASVTREEIQTTFSEVFGKETEPIDHLLYLVPVNGNGIRANDTANSGKRKLNISKEIDLLTHAVFGNNNEKNIKHYLDPDRLGDDQTQIQPKPTFAGSDSHSFEDLDNWLGKTYDGDDCKKFTTWIKADLSFDGLRQTIYEPESRVSISEDSPQKNDPMKVIDYIDFGNQNTFPDRVHFNPNLNSVIGSRSSGKSALLAYIDDAVSKSSSSQASGEPSDGPAAGISWEDVDHIHRSVRWADPNVTNGKVVYIRQNDLYDLSKDADAVSERISPVISLHFPDLDSALSSSQETTAKCEGEIHSAVGEWFAIEQQIDEVRESLRNESDHNALQSKVAELQQALQSFSGHGQVNVASPDQLEEHREFRQAVSSLSESLDLHKRVQSQLSAFLEKHTKGKDTANVPAINFVEVKLLSDMRSLPQAVQEAISAELRSITRRADSKVAEILRTGISLADDDITGISKDRRSLIDENAELCRLVESNREYRKLLSELEIHEQALSKVKDLELRICDLERSQDDLYRKISESRRKVDRSLEGTIHMFEGENRTVQGLTFSLEAGYSHNKLVSLAEPLNHKTMREYVCRETKKLQIETIADDPVKFLRALRQEKATKTGHNPMNLAKSVLSCLREGRLCAVLDGDRIGGFTTSNMTPGKQALFALTLILNESEDRWPLLLDQPEDDLDSRSIFDVIVPYLIRTKEQRQVIMVTHNANLAVGADSEAIIVANRHGNDRKNRDGLAFDYLVGPLENSRPLDQDRTSQLDMCGIREHVCELLDGGRDAFLKRSRKYQL